MTRTFCDRCGSEALVFKTANPLAKEGRRNVRKEFSEAHYSATVLASYTDEDWDFVFAPDLCHNCRIELAHKLVSFMEAHKS